VDAAVLRSLIGVFVSKKQGEKGAIPIQITYWINFEYPFLSSRILNVLYILFRSSFMYFDKGATFNA
jgi:hypothetical protein